MKFMYYRVGILVATSCVSNMTHAAEPDKSNSAELSIITSKIVIEPSLRIFFDTSTNKLQAEPVAKGQAIHPDDLLLPAADYSKTEQITLADGMFGVKGKDEFRRTLVGRIASDGTIEEICLPTGELQDSTSLPSSQEKSP